MKLAVGNRLSKPKLNQSGFTHRTVMVVVLVFFCVFVLVKHLENHVSADSAKITSGISGYCLDDHNGKTSVNNVVDASKCNDTDAQDWVANPTSITQHNKYCLSVQGNGKLKGVIVLNLCDDQPGQVWLRDQTGFENPNSGLCLSDSLAQPTNQLFLSSCNNLSARQETWTPTSQPNQNTNNQTCTGSEGEKVACYAAKEWTTWQSNSVSHESLLTAYTDGAPYEEWCADFVSYVYKEAGYPFSQGDTSSWDENIAGNIQYMGFTEHQASTGYVPQPGDVAFFDYNAGHVEIVVSGGKIPTYIYGDSATIDPTTGNGQMMANTISNDGSAGQVIYYLSPN